MVGYAVGFTALADRDIAPPRQVERVEGVGVDARGRLLEVPEGAVLTLRGSGVGAGALWRHAGAPRGPSVPAHRVARARRARLRAAAAAHPAPGWCALGIAGSLCVLPTRLRFGPPGGVGAPGARPPVRRAGPRVRPPVLTPGPARRQAARRTGWSPASAARATTTASA